MKSQTNNQDTIYNITPVKITASKIRNYNTGSVGQEWTATQLEKLSANNVAELIGQEAGIYIKSYGQGSLSTSSVRGGSAGHTLVLWNGLPIQSAMLGLLDLTLMPTQISESINFTLGGNSALWGSGAIGGVLNLENQADFSQKINVNSLTTIGSFGRFQEQINVVGGNGKIQLNTKISYHQSTNDFHYFLAEGIPDRQQTNAKFNQQMIGQDLYWKINNRNKVAVHFWWQKTNKQIPPTNVQTRSEAHQDDLTTRAILSYQHIEKNGLWNFKAGFFNEHLNYFDEPMLLESRSLFRTYLAEITRQWIWKKNHEFLIGNTYTRTKVWTDDYSSNNPTEFKKALFASWKFRKNKLNTQFSLRQEMIDQTIAPIIPSFGFDYNITPSFLIKGKCSRNYRLPTFNDRFWLPGGNPDLAPESGWSQELTLNYKHKKDNFLFDASITAFNRNIDNWILWSIQEGQSFWSANNVTKVWSRGMEPRMQIDYQLNKITLKLHSGYNYIRSTNQVALEKPKMEVGDQLIYTPIHNAFSTFSVSLNKFDVTYQHTMTGSTNGINNKIDAYQVGNFRIQYSNTYKSFKGTLHFNINNIWDTDYQVIERRPMPGIFFETGLKINFKKNKTT